MSADVEIIRIISHFRLVHDRELQLYDGSRLLHAERYDALKNKSNLLDEDMLAKGLYRIHPAFRIVALAEPPVLGAAQGQWLTPEALTLFLYQNMRRLSSQETISLVQKLVNYIQLSFLSNLVVFDS